MPRLVITLFAFFILNSQLFIASHCLAETTWQSIGPFGGASSIVIDHKNSQVLYAGTNNGVFKSTNGGASWTSFNTGLLDKGVQAIVVDPTDSQTLYVGTLGEVYKTVNGCASWMSSNTGITSTSSTIHKYIYK
jgi:photosystem II stability/assembly factor-like uncharacterized protein